MLRRPVKPRGLCESSAALSESESSALVAGGSGFGMCFTVVGEQQLDVALCTLGLHITGTSRLPQNET